MQRLTCLWLLCLLGCSFVNFQPALAQIEDLNDLDFDADEEDSATADLLRDMDDDDSEEMMDMPPVGGAVNGAVDEAEAPHVPVIVETVPYHKPSTSGLEFAETFDGDVFSRWSRSAHEKFTGTWLASKRMEEAIVGDVGLSVVDEARHHGIAAKAAAMADNEGKTFVMSYEVKFEDNLNCGGAYLKAFSTEELPTKGADLKEFSNETPYVVMFGPDRCGATNKVHLIIRQKNPVSNEWIEHHLVDPPRVPFGKETHVYTFVISEDNSYKVLVDNKVEKEGNMHTDFDPSFTPPTEIDDVTDSKPDDWVDEESIADPEAVKPEDWNEDAPRTITDPEAVMPEGWLEDEAKMVPDVDAVMPESWDEEEDGEWTAPLVSNPLCTDSPGCGPWVAPQVPNPEFKGKWAAPMIPNTEFKGPWAPRKIPNPHFFTCENPHAIGDVNAVGFELWTMQKGILFDNIVMARSMSAVTKFIEDTWAVRHGIETMQDKAKGAAAKTPGATDDVGTFEKVVDAVMMFSAEQPLVFAGGLVGIIIVVLLGFIRMCKRAPVVEAKPTESTDAKKDGKKAEKETASKKKTAEKAASASAAESSEEEDNKEENKEEELKEKKKSPSTRQRRARKD